MKNTIIAIIVSFVAMISSLFVLVYWFDWLFWTMPILAGILAMVTIGSFILFMYCCYAVSSSEEES